MIAKFPRRNFLKTTGAGLLAAPVASAWQPEPSKSPLVLNARELGATGDGVAKDTAALQQAIDRCHVLGGGEVLIPAGIYSTGALALRSHVTLRLEKDAILRGTPDFADYPVTQVRWEGKWIAGYAGLIYAIDAERIGIVGPGRIEGNHKLGGRPNAQNTLRHPALIEPINCRDVRFEDFSTDYYLMWCLHLTYCENVAIRNLTIRSTGGNGDGIDIDSCKHVRIEGCDISTGDDCIAIKSGRGAEAYALLRTTEDVTISNCTLADAIFACIGIGSETSGGIRNVRIEHCKFTHAQTFAVYIKSRPGRGAFIEDIVANDLEASGMTGGFLRINALSSGIQDQDPVPGDEGIPTLRNFRFSNIRLVDCPLVADATGIHPNKPLDGFSMVNVTGGSARGILLANMKNVELRDAASPIGTYNVTGTGLEGATTIPAPKLPDPIPVPAKPYVLK